MVDPSEFGITRRWPPVHPDRIQLYSLPTPNGVKASIMPGKTDFDEPYRFGERAMLQVRRDQTVDCVVGGFRRVEGGTDVTSFLLGLYDTRRLLDRVGFCAGIIASGLTARRRDPAAHSDNPLRGWKGCV